MQNIPIYELYGENHYPIPSDQVHCETIESRSNLYNWNISPHRHKGLYQLLFLERGSADLQLDENHYQIQGPSLISIPPPVVHSFNFSPPVGGYVIMAPMFIAMRVAAHAAEGCLPVDLPAIININQDSNHAQIFSFLIRQLYREFRYIRTGRAAALESLLQLIFINGGRCLQTDRIKTEKSRADERITRFYKLVERDYASPRKVSDYARELGVSMVQLNKTLQTTVRKSAQGIIHSRIILEAKRKLIYTSLNIDQIALGLGFEDPPYFTRFFRRHTGYTPKGFRSAALKNLEENYMEMGPDNLK